MPHIRKLSHLQLHLQHAQTAGPTLWAVAPPAVTGSTISAPFHRGEASTHSVCLHFRVVAVIREDVTDSWRLVTYIRAPQLFRHNIRGHSKRRPFK